MRGLTLRIEGLTKGQHFSIIEGATCEGGDLGWGMLYNNSKVEQTFTRKSWGFDGGVRFHYCTKDNILVARCYTN